MINVELAVLQSLDQSDWWPLSRITRESKLNAVTAEKALRSLSDEGAIECRSMSSENNEVMVWRRQDQSIMSYFQSKFSISEAVA